MLQQSRAISISYPATGASASSLMSCVVATRYPSLAADSSSVTASANVCANCCGSLASSSRCKCQYQPQYRTSGHAARMKHDRLIQLLDCCGLKKPLALVHFHLRTHGLPKV